MEFWLQCSKTCFRLSYRILSLLPGSYLGDAESARFWLSALTDLQNRGVRDLLITSIDYLKGFGDAIETVFPLLPFILYPFL
ncbi:hypothetical protein GO730_33620 [Spirosoma sp. HMF3257]|uniref:Mutator family transposase n=1 Tax=Spirosoma telluris TaxID=2183553 RepID=A0A327NUY2_9BACT|nr:hypothetical protein [Spirosoma telluris]RAI77826.1 hypothetical protein HMF3257_33525 [Spirosoma telluris]